MVYVLNGPDAMEAVAHGVMLGMKSTTWAVSKKAGDGQTLAYTPMEITYEYVSASG
jgi:hypothetical protein